jgi:hypothetical protein
MSKPGVTTPKDPHAADDPIPALSALYQGEKTDASAIFNTAMAMMAVAVAYLVGAIPFVQKLGDGPTPWYFQLLLPIPLWLIIAFHSLITLNAMSHGISVQIIEYELFFASGLAAKVKRNMVGSASGDKIMDITQAKLAHKVTTVFVYGGVGILVVLFTSYSLYSAKELAWGWAMRTAEIGYVLIAVMVVASWLVGLRMISKDRPAYLNKQNDRPAKAG